ncbi:hypothetical protein ACJX0J_032641, partial [Zea mays]
NEDRDKNKHSDSSITEFVLIEEEDAAQVQNNKCMHAHAGKKDIYMEARARDDNRAESCRKMSNHSDAEFFVSRQTQHDMLARMYSMYRLNQRIVIIIVIYIHIYVTLSGVFCF